MKYKIKQAGKSKKTIHFHLSKELVSGELDRVYREIGSTASLPGFRTGKAPMELIKKRYRKEARDETVKNLVADSFEKAIEESDMKVLGMPEITNLEFDEEKGMSYESTFNVRPEIRLKGYNGLALKRKKTEIKDSDIDSEVNSLREMSAKFITKEGSAARGDYIISDVECTVEGHPSEKKENAWFYVGEDAFIPGGLLEGLKVNDEKDVEKVLPENYSKKDLAGKKANFHIRVKEIKEKILPELNDEFAATVGNFRSMIELREAIREAAKRRNGLREKGDLENQALALLDKTAVFDVPQAMVDRHLETLVQRTKERLKREGLSDEKIKSMENDFRERLKAEALRQIRAYFILDEIAKLENIEVSGRDMEDALHAIASSTNRTLEEVRKHYKDNNLDEDLKEEIRQRKVLDLIIGHAKIETVSGARFAQTPTREPQTANRKPDTG